MRIIWFLLFIFISTASYSAVHTSVAYRSVSGGYDVISKTSNYSVIPDGSGVVYCRKISETTSTVFVPTDRPASGSPNSVYYINSSTPVVVRPVCSSSDFNYSYVIVHISSSSYPNVYLQSASIPSTPSSFITTTLPPPPPPDVIPVVDSDPVCSGYCVSCSPDYSPIRCAAFGGDDGLGAIGGEDAPQLDSIPLSPVDSPVPLDPVAPVPLDSYVAPLAPDDVLETPSPDLAPSPLPQSSDLGSLDVVASVDSLSDRMASLFGSLVKPSDLVNQTEQIKHSLTIQTGTLSNDLSNLSAVISSDLEYQSDRNSYDISKQTADLTGFLSGSFYVMDNNSEVRKNELNASLIALNNNLIGDGVLTRDSLSTLNDSIQSLSAGTGSTTIDLTGVETRLDTVNSTLNNSLNDPAGVSYLSKIFNFFTDDPALDSLSDPSASLTSSLDSHSESERSLLSSELSDMVEEFTFNTETYSFVGSTQPVVFSFDFKGETITLDPWPIYMMASLVGVFIMVGSSILGLRIALGS